MGRRFLTMESKGMYWNTVFRYADTGKLVERVVRAVVDFKPTGNAAAKLWIRDPTTSRTKKVVGDLILPEAKP